MNLKHMRQLAGAVELDEHCGCEDDLAEGRAEAENAIWKFFPSDSKAKIGGHRKVMFTGSVAKAAKVKEYSTIKLSDLTDHQIQSVLAVIQKKGEATESGAFADLLSEDQLALLDGLDDDALREALNKLAENMLLDEATPDLVRHCVRSVGKKYGGDVSRAFAICNAQLQKAGYLKPNSMELTAKGKAREKQHDADPDADAKFSEYEKMLKAAKTKEDLDPEAQEEGKGWACLECGKKFRTAAAAEKASQNGCPKCGGTDIDLDEAIDTDAEGLEEGRKCEKCGAPLGAQNPGTVCGTCKFIKTKGAKRESITDRMRDLLGEAPKKTYKQAQDDILNGLEKDGWKVKRDLKVPHATSPTGDFKLFFKAQAIYKTHGKGDLGNARSLHLPDIRQGDYSTFSSALGRWTGRDMKDQPLPKKPAAPASALGKVTGDTKTFINTPGVVTFDPKLNPDQYRAKHGQCPDGYHYDDSTKRCVKSTSEAADKACPKCKSEMLYDDGCDCYECTECSYKGPNGPAEEVLRLAGVNRYPDRQMGKTESGFKGRAREFAGVSGAHDDWRLETPDEDRMDLWHPDKHVKNPGLPMDKDKPKAAAPADKGSALLKALRCPPGKEAKLVYGRPSCAPKS